MNFPLLDDKVQSYAPNKDTKAMQYSMKYRPAQKQ